MKITLMVFLLFMVNIFSFGETNTLTNGSKSFIDLITNDTHIVLLDESNLSLVYEVSQTKEEIYNKLADWIAINYNDSKSVIQNKDINTGKIIGKGVVHFPFLFITPMCEYTIIIDVKDKKYRVQYINYIYLGDGKIRREFDLNFEKNSIYEVQKLLILQSRNIYDSINSTNNNNNF